MRSENGINPSTGLSGVEHAREAKRREIIAAADACAGLVKARYSALEVDSWAIQQAQAERVIAGESLPEGALLTALAAANGVDIREFAGRVMANVGTAEAVTKLVIAQQQSLEARLKAAATEEEIAAIRAEIDLSALAGGGQDGRA